MERILVVDDEKLIRWSLQKNLSRAGYEVLEAEDGIQALEEIEEKGADLVLLDIRMPGKDGIEVLQHVVEHHPEVPVILMTAHSSVEGAVDAMKRGAFNYLVKPFSQDEMLVLVHKALETTKLRRELEFVRQRQKRKYGTENLVGKSQKMLEVCQLIQKVARSAATTVLVQGESGTGKDLVAQAIHFSSDRSTDPFMNITCSALPETLLETELMGYEKGAFTDAKGMKHGLLEVADGGTVFLDEIGDMGIGLQAKLLRFLEEKVIRRVGSSRDMKLNVRVVAATNRDLDQEVRDGNFRKDLYYRLKVIPVEIPPLRERSEDIPLLVTHFIKLFNAEFRKNTHGFTPEALKCFEQYDWPGNVRELRNVVERAMILENKDILGLEDLPPAVREEVTKADAEQAGDGSSAGGFALPDEGCGLRQMEEQMVRRALEKTNGNQSRAAQLLDISRDSLRYKMGKLGLL
jgi:DNA-binding NtrC family response regulator